MANPLTKLILSGMRYTVDELADKFTGRKLFDIMKSINKHKAAVNTHLKESPVKGAKTADSLIKKVAQAKNKRRMYQEIGEDVSPTHYAVEEAIEAGEMPPIPHVSLRKKGGKITKRKKGGKVGSGSAFVASLYK
jgi:hypothetical protein